ncbi:hypothetical protein Tco_0611618 [Tanacetum coccineum]
MTAGQYENPDEEDIEELCKLMGPDTRSEKNFKDSLVRFLRQGKSCIQSVVKLVDPQYIVMVVVSWHMKAATMCEFSKQEFVGGLEVPQRTPKIARQLKTSGAEVDSSVSHSPANRTPKFRIAVLKYQYDR